LYLTGTCTLLYCAPKGDTKASTDSPEQGLDVPELPNKKLGRPLLIGKKVGHQVNIAVAIASAEGILLSINTSIANYW